MRAFLKKILVFSMCIFIYLVIVFSFNYYQENNPKLDDSKILFLGDSHIKHHINPDSFYRVKNFGHSADILLGIEWKLKKILNTNKNVELVIISLSYNNFIEDYNFIFKDHYPASSKNLERYLLISDWNKLIQYKIGFKSLIDAIFSKIKKPIRELNYLGYFIDYEGIMCDSANSAIFRHFDARRLGYFPSYNKETEARIYRILKICKNNNVNCLFVLPPLSRFYIQKIPKDIKESTNQFIMKFSKSGNFLNIETNFSDSLFYDGDHLNSVGAAKYTYLVKEALKAKKLYQYK